MNYEERIERRPNVAGGEAVIKGTRVTLRTVLASLAEGATTAALFPPSSSNARPMRAATRGAISVPMRSDPVALTSAT